MQDGSLKNTDGVYEMNALPNGAADLLEEATVRSHSYYLMSLQNTELLKSINTFENFTEIKVRGLCQRSKFDSTYQVLNDERGYLGYKAYYTGGTKTQTHLLTRLTLSLSNLKTYEPNYHLT